MRLFQFALIVPTNLCGVSVVAADTCATILVAQVERRRPLVQPSAV
jgi:hypothetical protein